MGVNALYVDKHSSDEEDSGVRREMGLHELPPWPHLYHGCSFKVHM